MRLSFQCFGTCGMMRPVRIERLELDHVGPFIGASLDFPRPNTTGELVLLEGPNGCGKTTILHAIACLIGGKLEHLAAPSALLQQRVHARTREQHQSPSIVATFEHANGAPAQVRYDFGDNSARFVDKSEHTSAGQILGNYRLQREPSEWAMFAYESHGSNIALEASATTSLVTDDSVAGSALSPRAGKRGSDLAKLLLYLKRHELMMMGMSTQKLDQASEYIAKAKANTAALDKIKSTLSVVVGRDVDFHFVNDVDGIAITFGGQRIPSSVLGEGMRNTVSWLSDLLFRLNRIKWKDQTISPWEQEFWLILDEIEASLHPQRQMQIIPTLRSLFPNAHIYAATHSPFVVASAGEGTVIPIRPDENHMVRGKIEARPLQRGQSLAWVVSEIFQAEAGFGDQRTRDELEAHDRDVRALRRKQPIDWRVFLERRNNLWDLNEEVRTVVAMQEVPVRAQIEQQLRAQAGASHGSNES